VKNLVEMNKKICLLCKK